VTLLQLLNKASDLVASRTLLARRRGARVKVPSPFLLFIRLLHSLPCHRRRHRRLGRCRHACT
jgi:hypothetical protein